jgi:hypothetical protein
VKAHLNGQMSALLCLAVLVGIACDPEDPSRASTAVATSAGTVMSAPSPATASTASDSSAMDVFVDLVAALNRGDAAAAQSLLREDATWERGGQCGPGQCSGLVRVRQELDRDVAAHHRLDVVSSEVAGNTLNARVELQTDQTRAAGVTRVVQLFEVGIMGGKISSVRVVNDLSDPGTAVFTGQRGGGGGNPGAR